MHFCLNVIVDLIWSKIITVILYRYMSQANTHNQLGSNLSIFLYFLNHAYGDDFMMVWLHEKLQYCLN